MGGEGTHICKGVYETDEMAATERRTTVGKAHDMNMRGEEGTDICKSVYETDEMAATESRTAVEEVERSYVIISEKTS